MATTRLTRRAASWIVQWGPILPLLVAEFILWTGFGALLPVMPLYFTEHGVPIAMLGVVIAAWPAARLVTEPLFGILADRTARLPLMVGGLVLAAASVGSMALWASPVAFIVLRALSGLGTAMYDPAARGYLTDATPSERRGEVFGLYNAAQQGGILLGPAIGGLGTALAGGYQFVLVFSAVMTIVAAIAVALRVRELRGPHAKPFPALGLSEFPGGTMPDTSIEAEGRAVPEADSVPLPSPARAPVSAATAVPALPLAANARHAPAAPPPSLRNRFILAAILVNMAGYFGGGLYETIWGLFVLDRGGSVVLVGATFATFGLTTILVSPIGGRIVDRRGPYPFVVGGLLVMVVTMLIYPFSPTYLYIPLVAVEAIGFSFLGPATYTVIGRGTPQGQSSTAQGLVGSAGTVGTIVAAIATGVLAAVDLNAPFFIGAAVIAILLVVVLASSGRLLRSMRPISS
ncbi:MAG: MFS transporter [Chloroflexota bacterium]